MSFIKSQNLNEREFKQRYARQIAIEEIGIEGQRKIHQGKILVVGCGALGSMVAMQLAGAGVGVIGLCDFDTVDISNLQRQFFFNTDETGESKLMILSKRIKALNPEVSIKDYPGVMNTGKAKTVIKEYDFIIDATDNPETKKIIGEICKIFKKPCCIAGVNEFRGQVMTFLPGDSRFEEFFGSASAEGFLPCSLSGVLGPAAVLCASIQVSEALKYLCGIGSLLSDKLFFFDLLSNNFHIFKS